MPIKLNALSSRTVAAIERLERAMNAATGSTITADCADISAMIDSIDDLLNTYNKALTESTIRNMSSEDLTQAIRDMSSEVWARLQAVKHSMAEGAQ